LKSRLHLIKNNERFEIEVIVIVSLFSSDLCPGFFLYKLGGF